MRVQEVRLDRGEVLAYTPSVAASEQALDRDADRLDPGLAESIGRMALLVQVGDTGLDAGGLGAADVVGEERLGASPGERVYEDVDVQVSYPRPLSAPPSRRLYGR